MSQQSSSSASSSSSTFGKSVTAAEVLKGIDLKGVVALVTGGTSGIGIETVRVLYSAGATVIVTARDKAKFEKVLSSLRSSSSSSSGSLELLECDLASIASVKRAAQSLLDRKPRLPLHLLINNAGVSPTSYQRSVDGLEINYAVNTIAPVLLSVLLAPLLAHAASASSPLRRRARVVTVASAAHAYTGPGGINYDIIKLPHSEEAEKAVYSPNAFLAYGSSKLAIILATREYARLYAAHGIDAYSLHPGVIRTPMAEPYAERMAALGFAFDKTLEQGAATTVFVATSPAVTPSQSGYYYEDCAVSSKLTAPVDDAAAAITAFQRALEFGGLSASSLALSPSFPAYSPKTPAIKILEDSSHSVAGKVVIVTGASSGIGVETARVFAHGGAHVFVGARNVEAANAVIADIKKTTKNEKVELLKMDLTSFASVRAAAAEFKARKLPLHYLILNAGIANAGPYGLHENHEAHFTVNHLSHFLFTTELVDVLVASAPARVVSVTSSAHKITDVKFDDINFTAATNPYNRWAAYGQSKTANIYFSFYLNHLYAAKGVHAIAVHPGVVATPMFGRVSQEEKDAMGLDEEKLKATIKNTEEGAASTLFAAVSNELYLRGGVYVEDNHVARKQDNALQWNGVGPYIEAYTNEGVGKRLWEYSAKAVDTTSSASANSKQ